MRIQKFSLISFIFFICSHLALIPVLSYFGVNICPVMQEHGFLFGCKVATQFAVTVVGIQTLTLFGFFYAIKKWPKTFLSKSLTVNLLPVAFLAIHFFNFYLNSTIYDKYLSDISPNADSIRMFLWICMSMILVTTWQWVETELLFITRKRVFKESISNQSLFQLWVIEQKNKIIPVIGIVLFFGSYFSLMFIRQSGWENPEQIMAEQKEKFFYLTGVVIVWQMVIFYFDFHKNLILSREVECHLQSIQSQNFKFRSNTMNSGFFSVIFNLMNRLSDTLVKKGRLLKGFSSFVSDTVAQDILAKDDQTYSYSGDSKKVAIMMADIRNFTTISSQLKPQDVVDMLNIYFSDMIEVFVENGIVVDKFMGDGILAYAIEEGSPQVYENMLKAAFDMHIKLNQTNIKLKKKNLPKIQLGIGLHEGPVILGSIGSKDRLQYTIIGDPVNVTSRLEGLCKDNQVGLVVSSHFLNKVNLKHRSKFTNLGLQKIRGLELPLEVHGAIAQDTRKQQAA
ncbi:MAG: hypothetical protein B7Y39_14160 [Bdellovibrio sp. 28-41-41]|nr:MAG: hypothetical protein B7Y39_14160 [Bdellovibrio sp. 28-41-41]